MIRVDNVSKKYGKFLANDRISITANKGELSVLLGPNGAGKSTLIKSICGLLRFEGQITINGFENHSLDAKRVLSYVPEMPVMYPMLSVEEHIEFVAKAYKLKKWEERAEDLFKRFELDDKRKKLGQELSKGMQQKVSICCAFVQEPKAVVLDEPFVGLDPHAIRELKKLFIDSKEQNIALLISTHMIDSLEENWDTTYIMKESHVIRTCKRTEMEDASSLEALYFEITESAGGDE